MSDSHTAFSPSAFTLGAAGGALTLAGVFVGTLQSLVQVNREAARRWERDQLEKAFEVSELLRWHKHEECEELKRENEELSRENERLKAVVKSMTVRPARSAR